MKILVLFYSTYGHLYNLAQAVADGVREIPGTEVEIKRIAETLPPELVDAMGAREAQSAFAAVPVAVAADLAEADVIFFGTPTRFGKMAAQMKSFLNAARGLWTQGDVTKAASVFTSSTSQGAGRESALHALYATLRLHGMHVVRSPEALQGRACLDEGITAWSQIESALGGARAALVTTENEMSAAKRQGRHVALVAMGLDGLRGPLAGGTRTVLAA